MGPLGELGALFNPGMRHEIEERQAKANRREEEGNARDGDLRIDLASGVAVIDLSKGANGADRVAAPVGAAASEDSQQPAESQHAADETAQDSGHTQAAAVQDNPRPTGPLSTDDSAVENPGADDPDADTSTDKSADAGAQPAAGRGSKPLTAAQARRLATAARRSASGDQPPRPVTPRPANAQLPSSKATRAAR